MMNSNSTNSSRVATLAAAILASNLVNGLPTVAGPHYRTIIEKDMRGKWKAESYIPLGPNPFPQTGDERGFRVLCVTTSKGSRGGLRTYAMVETILPYGGYQFEVYGDFQETVLSDPTKRATDKSVASQHDTAMSTIETTLARCHAFYDKKDAEGLAKLKQQRERAAATPA